MPSPEYVLGRRSWSQVGQVAHEALATARAHTNARTLVNFRNCPKRNIIEREIVHSSWRNYWTMGSACHSGLVELSPVLKAMNLPPEIGMSAIRFSLGRTTTRDKIEATVSQLTDAISRLA
jgi:hypothetical protein